MCENCEMGGQQVGISPTLAARAKRLEAAMPGARVTAHDWDILLGHAGGAVPWAQTRRMLESLELAARRDLRCDAG
jgi:hypothetical protein